MSVDALTPRPIRFAPGFDIPPGTLTQGTPYVVTYIDADSAFYLHGTGAGGGGGGTPTGSLFSWPIDPGTVVLARAGGASGLEPFIECDGSLYLVSSFPTLASFFGGIFGGDGVTTFGVPTLSDTGRFLRSRYPFSGAGVGQVNALAEHFHNFAGSGTSSVESAAHTHAVPSFNAVTSVGVTQSGANISAGGVNVVTSVTPNVSTITPSPTGGELANHTHTFSVGGTTDNGGLASAETRPEAFVVVYGVKT